MTSPASQRAEVEYVVVGSGAGGGTLAARLAEAGRRVVLLEAGGDPRAGGSPNQPGADRLPDDYDVPVFHAFASENEAMNWDFFVRHYADQGQQSKDKKYYPEYDGRTVDGVLYPRASALGGCTAHNAMIMMYPHSADWDELAELTGDESWRACAMRGYFERLEDCRHRLFYRWLAKLGPNPTRHGWNGWLRTEKAFPRAAFFDRNLLRTIWASTKAAAVHMRSPLDRIRWFLESQGDPNDWRLVTGNNVGIRYLPLATRNGQRMGARERVLDVARRFPDRLRVELDALATRVLFDGENRAVGVEYLKGRRLYRAGGRESGEAGERREVYASRETILAGGAFNTPQLLMLSGIGRPEELAAHRIPPRPGLNLCGVGRNLQDRYEVGVVNRMAFPEWKVLRRARFERGDPQYEEWARCRRGVYSTSGAVLAAITCAKDTRPVPDLVCFALLGPFRGYFPGYSDLFRKHRNYLTWAIIKGHTQNRAGEVTLQSDDPRVPPRVNFCYFEEGDDGRGEDLEAVVEGIRFVRRLTRGLKECGLIEEEEVPGEDVQTDAELKTFVRNNAWGHHASCTCAIGPREKGGVLSSDFRVHGTEGLRVVDASVFPRIPGFFIVGAVYMIAEKAADVILEAAQRAGATATSPGREEGEKEMAATVSELLKMSQAQLDELFKKSEPGPIPNGEAKGTAIVAPGTNFSEDIAEFINHFAWQGKNFDAKNGVLRNRILPFGLNAIIAKVYKAPSWLDGKECIVLDYSETSLVARWIRDEIRQIGPNMYLGKVYWDKARLIDFALQF
jgi:choline dehydrogenase-like flavoprotein